MKEKISIKTFYLLGIITIGLIALGVGSTYAMFTTSAEINNPITIDTTLNSDSDIIESIDIEIEPNDTRVIVININSTTNTNLNYASFYVTENNNIEVGVTHKLSNGVAPTGIVEGGSTKKVYIQIKNNDSSTTNVTLGVLSNSGNIVKSESMTLINDTNIDTTSPELLITGQDMIVKDGLIRYYDGNNNSGYSHSSNTTIWKDLSGNYDGEVKSSTWSTDSITLNGTNSHVRIGQINNLTAVTVEVYLKANSYTTDSANQIISNYNGNGLVLQLNKGVPGFSIGSGKTIASDETIDLGINHTITGTYDGSNVKLYVDGVLKKTLSSTAGISNPSDSTPMVIGCNPNETGCDTHYTNANIYAVRVYNRALTESEIKQNMNADRISTKSTSSDVNGIYTFISNKRLSNFTADNITLTNGTKGTFTKINDRKYNLNISGVAVSSTLGLDISANVFTDISGNNNTVLTYSRYRDGTGPTATITKNTSTSRTVTYTISFHEPAYGFTVDDITLSEGTKGTFTKVDQKTYTLVVTHASDGSKTITVKANGCNDRFGNLNAAKSLTHTIDSIKPTVKISSNTTTSRTVTYTFTFSENVNGFTANSITLSEGTKGTFTKVSNTKYTLVVTHASDGKKTISVSAGTCKDNAGNALVASSYTTNISTITLATYITNLYNNGAKSSVTNNRISYNVVSAQSLMNDRKGSSSIGVNSGNIRYYGANPNNYIYFNCSDYNNQSSSTCETWRIIGVFDGKVKIMRGSIIGSYSWDSSASTINEGCGVNEWSQADLMKLLNGGYESESVGGSLYWNAKSGTCYNSYHNATTSCDFTNIGLKNATTRNLIIETTYYTRGYNNSDIYADAVYNKERNSGTVMTGVKPTRALTWTGKIAVPYPSDYGYATDLSICQTNIHNYDTKCLKNNWMKDILTNNGANKGWLLTPNSANASLVWNTSSRVASNGNANFAYGIAPVLYLNSKIGIKPGTGTSSNPYQLNV